MPVISGGRVVYSRTVQPAQYESKKAEVELTFGVEEGAELGTFLDETAALAIAKAHEMVGISTAAKPKPATSGKPKEIKVEPPSQKEAAAAAMNAKDAAPKPAPKDEIDLDVKPAISTGEARKDPAQVDPDGLDLEGGPQPITDKEVIEAVSKTMARTNNPKAIKEIREKYVQVPKGVKDIPQDKRAEFIAEVLAIK